MMSSTSPTREAREFAAAAVCNYSDQLHRFLRRRAYHAQDLDDLVQEVYLRLLRVRHADQVRDPLAYIYGVASHVASEFNMRNRKGRVVFDSPTVEATMEARTQTTGRKQPEGGGYLQRHVNDALAELNSTRLAVLVLERRDGLTHAQIAERLGLSVHTVKKYSVQALAHVRASLER
jgi:RNA polymerase sigma-70 factor (ECF subfamily)